MGHGRKGALGTRGLQVGIYHTEYSFKGLHSTAHRAVKFLFLLSQKVVILLPTIAQMGFFVYLCTQNKETNSKKCFLGLCLLDDYT